MISTSQGQACFYSFLCGFFPYSRIATKGWEKSSGQKNGFRVKTRKGQVRSEKTGKSGILPFYGFNVMPRRIPDFPDSFHSWNFLSRLLVVARVSSILFPGASFPLFFVFHRGTMDRDSHTSDRREKHQLVNRSYVLSLFLAVHQWLPWPYLTDEFLQLESRVHPLSSGDSMLLHESKGVAVRARRCISSLPLTSGRNGDMCLAVFIDQRTVNKIQIN